MSNFGYFSKHLNDYLKQEIMKTEIFKVGDRVFCTTYGWGIVIRNESRDAYPVHVEFDNSSKTKFTYDGRIFKESNPTLSFTEYTLQGFSQERPIKLPEVGENVLVRNENDEDWILRQFSKYALGSSYPFHTSDRDSFCVKSWSKLKRIKILD